jgi:hypothetical protein
MGAAALNEIAGKESRTYLGGFRSDVVDVPVQGNSQLHYMIRMKPEDTVVYSWEVMSGSPNSFYAQFHAHIDGSLGHSLIRFWRPGDMLYYYETTGSKASGSLIAPLPGLHGWIFQNKGEAPVVLRLHIAGIYELVPGGQLVGE